MNFDFLKEQNGYYDMFAEACIEAERILRLRPRCARSGVVRRSSWR